MLLAAGAALVILHHVGDIFHLAVGNLVIWGFWIYAMGCPLLHALELASYAAGNISSARVMAAPIATGVLAFPSAMVFTVGLYLS